MVNPLGYREDDVKTNIGISYLTVFSMIWLGGVRRCHRQVEPNLGVSIPRDFRTRPPYVVAADKATRNEFRRFMEKNPDAYDYSKAQVSWERKHRQSGMASYILARSLLLS